MESSSEIQTHWEPASIKKEVFVYDISITLHRFSAAPDNNANRMWVFVNRIIGFDPVLLTQNDLYMIGLTKSNRIHIRPDDLPVMRGTLSNRSGFSKKSLVIVGFEQREVGGTVQYWLFDSASTAKKMAADGARWTCAAMPISQLEINPENVIGDATWRGIFTTNRSKWGNSLTTLWFVKYNLLVSVRPDKHLQYAQDVARKIEAKINAVLEKK